MFNLFLAALGMDYLQHGKPPCQHEELYLDHEAKVVRCKGCRDWWELPRGWTDFPPDWEERVRWAIARDRQQQ